MIQKYYRSKNKNYQKINPSNIMQQQSDSPRQPTRTSQQSQHQPIIGDQRAFRGRNMSISGPMAMTLVFCIMTILFILFILFIVYLLTPQKPNTPLDKNQINEMMSLQSQETNIVNVSTLKINSNIQSFIQLEQFLSKNNTKNEAVDLFFAKFLLTSKNSQQKDKLQKQYYTKLFGQFNTEEAKQLPMCIIATGRNNVQGDRYKKFLQSVQNLQYKQYRLIIVDDASQDQTPRLISQYIQRSQILRQKAKIILRKQRYYALANKIKAIEEECKQGDIIVDVDPDDRFIGRQVLHVVNHLYQKYNQAWFIYSNHVLFNSSQPFSENLLQRGPNQALSQQQFYNYRVLDKWVTSHLKSYRREIFMKIDQSQWKLDNGQICHWASDRYILYSIMEMAGIQRTKFFNILLYYYDYTAAGNVRNLQIIKPDKIRTKILTPYQKLENFNDKPKKRQNYQAPKQLIQSYRRAELKYKALLKRQEQSIRN